MAVFIAMIYYILFSQLSFGYASLNKKIRYEYNLGLLKRSN